MLAVSLNNMEMVLGYFLNNWNVNFFDEPLFKKQYAPVEQLHYYIVYNKILTLDTGA